MRIKHIRQTLLNASFLLATISLFCHNDSRAQSFIPTGPMISPGYQFAALTGYHGAWQVNGVYRNQWPGIPSTYHSLVASSDLYVHTLRSGIGIQYFADRSSGGVLRKQEVRISVAPRFNLGEQFSLLTGLAYGYGQRSLDLSQLTIGDMIDQRIGQIVQPAYIDKSVVRFHRLAFSGGFQAFERLLVVYQHTTGMGQNESHVDGYSRFPSLHHTYLSYRIALSESSHLTPSVRYARQGEFNYLMFNMNACFKSFLFGAGYRMGDAVLVQAGYRLMGRFVLTYSYDMTVSSLATQTLGSHEVGIRATLFKGRAENVLIKDLQIL